MPPKYIITDDGSYIITESGDHLTADEGRQIDLDSFLSKLKTTLSSYDSMIVKTNTVNSIINAYLANGYVNSETIDAILQKAESLQLSLHADLMSINTLVNSIDAVLLKHVKGRLVVITEDASVIITEDGSVIITEESATAGPYLSLDSTIQKINETSLLIDSILVQTESQAVRIESLLSFSSVVNYISLLDAQLEKENFSSLYLDVLTEKQGVINPGYLDSLLSKSQFYNVSMDIALIDTHLCLLGCDSLLSALMDSDINIDSMLKIEKYNSLAMDAIANYITFFVHESLDVILKRIFYGIIATQTFTGKQSELTFTGIPS